MHCKEGSNDGHCERRNKHRGRQTLSRAFCNTRYLGLHQPRTWVTHINSRTRRAHESGTRCRLISSKHV